MKWEGRIAKVVLALVVILIVRSLLVSHQEDPVLPAIIEEGQPFYAVYFASADGKHLQPEFRPGENTVDRLLADLVEGPRRDTLYAVLPAEVRVLGYSRRGGILYVNLSHHLRTNHPGGSRAEMLTVYGIVNTLVDAPGVDEVQILIENKQQDTLVGHINLSKPLKKDYNILGSTLI